MAAVPVRAAGGVVWRRTAGEVEVLLVHRARYDDWTFPKGKLDPGESWEHAAVREVFEETGVVPVVGAELASTDYVDAAGQPKTVRYWSMAVAAAVDFEPNDEISALRWVPVGSVGELLTYERDVPVLVAFASTARRVRLIASRRSPVVHPTGGSGSRRLPTVVPVSTHQRSVPLHGGKPLFRNRRWAALVALFLAFSLVAAACGDDDSSSSSTDTTAAGGSSDTIPVVPVAATSPARSSAPARRPKVPPWTPGRSASSPPTPT